jgi:hypothetical protein
MELSVVGKMLQMLKEIAPTVSHISMIYNPDNRLGCLFVRSFEFAAGSLGFKPIIAHIHGLADIESAIAQRQNIEGPTDRDWVGICFETEISRRALDSGMTQESPATPRITPFVLS